MNEIPILCLQSQNDEAELLLSVGTAPDRLYREYVRSSLGAIGRALEIVFVRPFLLAAILRAVEMVLERAALGVSLWRTLFLDYQVATIDGRPYYSRRLLVTHQLGLKPATNQAEIQSGN